MFLLIFAALCASGLSIPLERTYSFSLPAGTGSGTGFLLEGEGSITGVRVWDHDSSYIYGIQLRFGYIWSKVAGRASGTMHEMELFDNERIVQVSGKYQGSLIYQLLFVASGGRFLAAGQPKSTSFNMYPRHQGAELRKLSGQYDWAVTSLAAHWGKLKNATTMN
ncbi:zymogen granule membrane protein 16-like [Nelusetta ayraudi]|uniref:zymogen granule membrane protein 16-like n=1 Tax=Nelusetta ayraudi TaxID=303726 RepID=UPI003F71E074